MPDAPEIKVKLTAEDTGVSAAIKELTSQLKNLKKQQDETASSGLSLKKAFEGIAAAGALLELSRVGKEAFDSAINIGKMADKTGLTTQTLSVYHHVAEEASVSTEAVDKALTKAAKSITEFEQGSAKAAKGFQLLGITQKDFAGLKPDEKIALVTARLGGMAEGFQKATAAQLIFSKSGAEFIPVANAIAAEGLDKVTESARRLGLLLDQKTTDSFRVAKASMTELASVGKGMATQFEAGLLPAIIDVSGALTDSLTQGGVSFQDLGRHAGNAVKTIALVFLGLGQTLGTVVASVTELWSAEFDFIKNEGTKAFEALGQAAHGDFSAAFNSLKAGVREGTNAVKEEIARQKAIYASLFDSIKSDYANLFQAPPKKPPVRPDDQSDAPAVADASADKAHLAFIKQQLDQELALYREYESVRLAEERRLYDQGQLSLTDYFARRRAETIAEHEEEIQVLESQKAQQKKEPAANAAEQIQNRAKIQAIDAKIAEAREAQVLKLKTLETEEFQKREENQNKVLDFQKQIAALQGKSEDVTKATIAQESEKLRIQLAQAGQSKQQIDQEIAQFTALKTAQAEFKDAQTKLRQDEKAFQIEKQAIEIRARAGQISSVEKEKEINALIRERLPVLRADAAAEMSAAQKTGNQDDVVSAQAATEGVQNLGVQTNQLQQQVRGSLTNDFNTFFMGLGRSTASAADQFRQLAASIVQSLEQIILKKLLLKALGGDGSDNSDNSGGGSGSGGGGLFGLLSGLLGGGHAEGGLIKGPGGPKSDSIPARVSPGEYIVKADAVSKVGVDYLESINRGLNIPSIERFSLPKFAEGGLVGSAGVGGGGDSNIHLGIGLDEGLILKHLSSKAAGNVILQHLANNPKAAGKALSRSD
jgi:hypothetical protein